MTTTVQKWGNSLAVRIPSKIVDEINLEQGSDVEIKLENQAIIISPIKKKPTLEELLSKITPKNRHEEVDFGRQEGKERL